MKKAIILLMLPAIIAMSANALPPQAQLQPQSLPQPQDKSEPGMLIMFWNLENMFDTDSENGGAEFSRESERRWTPSRFAAKCQAIAKTILWTASQEGRLPEIICFAELENRAVLKSILSRTALWKYGYGIAHYESADPRGIDVGLLYRKEVLDTLKTRKLRPEKMNTRDILQVDFACGLHVFVNHHPSKYGGARISGPRRIKVMQMLKDACDSLLLSDPHARIVATGDFNDNPDGEAFGQIRGTLANLAEPLYERGEGTIRFDGKWDLIDMFLVSESLVECTKMKILKPPFLLTHDKAHGGDKVLRTYSGPQYIGGISDHLPILLEIW